MKTLLLFLLFLASQTLRAQVPEGIWQGYDGEWKHVSSQLIALAEATPDEKFAWRPAAGVRSTSEVYMHIVLANFYMLKAIGSKMPAELKEGIEKQITSKGDVISWLKRSLEAVKQARSEVTAKDLQRKIDRTAKVDATVDDMYLHMLAHTHEHMGQLIAYARMTGVVPPWSKG